VKGDLADVDLHDLIRVCCQHMDDVRLSVTEGDSTAVVYLSKAAIVHAESPRGVGKAALFDALNRRSGTFDLEKDVAAPARTIDQPWGALLIEAAELLDESRRLLAESDPQAAGPSAPVAPGRAGEGGAPVSPPDEILRRLGAIDGVEGALLSGPAGEVLASLGENEPERLAAVTAFTGGAADEVGELLSLGALRRVVVDQGRERDLVVKLGNSYLGVRLGEQAAIERVCAQARNLLGGD